MTKPQRSRPHARALRVLIASSERGYYGGESQALLLATGLRERGHAPVLLAREEGALFPRAVGAGLEAVPWRPGHSPRRMLWTRRLLRGSGADVLHCNDSGALTAAAGVAVGLPLGTRVASRRVAFPIRSPFAYRALADGVICVSEHVRGICADAGLPDDRLHLVHDGVDADRLGGGDRERGRAALGLAADAEILLNVASLNECKGHRILLEAVAPLLERPSLHLVLAGDGPLRDEIVAAASRSPYRQRIHVLGYRGDVPDLLRAADVFVLPSLQEGLGTALLEAMFVGLPCVASDLGGTREALGSSTAPRGWLAAPGDADDLASALAAVLEDPGEATRRGRRARAEARARFTADRMVEGTLSVYGRLLSGA